MVIRTQLALSDASEWLGQWHPLAEQLGSADGLTTLGSVTSFLNIRPVCDLSSLREFLENYQSRVQLPLELPAIQEAHGHTERNELRELVVQDVRMAGEPIFDELASASRRVGQGQLFKLRPLRDHRFLRRYIEAVERGEANGWHTLVYGVTLSIYSLPLRQGLLGYAHQTTRGFIYSAARMLHLSEGTCRAIFDQLCEPLPDVIDDLVKDQAIAEPVGPAAP